MIDHSAFQDYYKFEKEIKYKNRFFVDSVFVESVKEAIKLNTNIKTKGTILYRARIHRFEDIKTAPLSRETMLNPKSEEAVRGRANPDGISYLYLSTNIYTCIKELIPKEDDILTIAEFSLKQNVNLIDFTGSFPSSESEYITSLNHCIRLTFSNSQLSSRPELEYLPYQFICELIKNEKYNGVLYNSSRNKDIFTELNNNIVLFDSTLADIDKIKRSLIKIISTKYEYEKIE
jgi:RES domain